MLPRLESQPLKLRGRVDTTPALGKARTKDEADVAKCALVAHWAGGSGWLGVVAGNTQEFGLGVTDLCSFDNTFVELTQHPSSIEAVVHRSFGGPGPPTAFASTCDHRPKSTDSGWLGTSVDLLREDKGVHSTISIRSLRSIYRRARFPKCSKPRSSDSLQTVICTDTN
jgi:hypothetical protein